MVRKRMYGGGMARVSLLRGDVELLKVENTIKKRFPIGTRVSEARIVAELTKQVCRVGLLVFSLLAFFLTPSLTY